MAKRTKAHRPNDIPHAVWKQALTLVDSVIDSALYEDAPDCNEVIARALMAEHERQVDRIAELEAELKWWQNRCAERKDQLLSLQYGPGAALQQEPKQ